MFFFYRVNDATVKLDRIMECVLDTSGTDDSEGAPTVSQPTYIPRPPTRDLGGLERRLGRMEENVASIFETVKTLVDLLHNQRVWNGYILYLQRNYVPPTEPPIGYSPKKFEMEKTQLIRRLNTRLRLLISLLLLRRLIS